MKPRSKRPTNTRIIIASILGGATSVIFLRLIDHFTMGEPVFSRSNLWSSIIFGTVLAAIFAVLWFKDRNKQTKKQDAAE